MCLGKTPDLAATGMLLWRLFHALREQHLEFMADLLGLSLEFVEKPAFLVLELAVRKEHLS
jgi:hypothetical protein